MILDPLPADIKPEEYLNTARSVDRIPVAKIDAPDANLSAGIALKGLGSLFEESTNVADLLVKQDIANQVYAKVDTQRDAFTSAMQTTRAAQMSPRQTMGADTDLIGPPDPNNVPGPIQSLPGKLAILANAGQNNKINERDLYAKYMDIAKQLRTQYPGYRAEIDSEISKVTGVDPANAYLSSLISDINAAGTLAKTEREKTVSQIREMNGQGIPNADVYLNGLEANDPRFTMPVVNAFVNKANSSKWKYTEATQNNTLQSQAREEDRLNTSSAFDQRATDIVNSHMQTQWTIAGLDDPVKLDDLSDKIKSGAVSPENLQSVLASIQSTKLQTELELNKEANTPNKNGITPSMVVGSDKVQAQIKNKLVLFDAMSDAISKGDTGWAGIFKRSAEGMSDSDRFRTLQSTPTDTRIILAKLKELRSSAGDLWTNTVGQSMLSKSSNVLPSLQGWFLDKSTDLITAPKSGTISGTTTLNSVFNDAQRAEVDTPALYDQFLNHVKLISDPKTPDVVKENLVKRMFAGDNQYLFSNKRFQEDYTDPDSGRFIPGKYSAFARMASPDIAANVAKLSANDPNLGSSYKNMLETSFGRYLFKEDIENLNTRTATGLHVGWDNEKNQLLLEGPNKEMLVDRRGAHRTTMYTPEYAREQQAIENINIGLGGLSNVERAFGGDVSAFVLQSLKNSGLNLADNIDGIPNKIKDAIIQSRKDYDQSHPKSIKDTFNTKDTGKSADRVMPGDNLAP